MEQIYWDNAATTEVTDEVLDAMLPYPKEQYGNPSSKHTLGMSAKLALNGFRKTVASSLGCEASEVYFTSGGSEANNMAIKGIAMSHLNGNKRDILISSIEHHSVLNQIPQLKQLGFNVITIPVNPAGVVDLDFIKESVTDNTLLVSVMTVNNETGAVQPIRDISEVCKQHNVILHSDAVQALGHAYLPIECVDLMSFSGHKIHTPKGIGCLIVKDGVELSPLICGGAQENGLRGGTENVAMIAGFAEAVNLYGKINENAVSSQLQACDLIKQRLSENHIEFIVNSGKTSTVSNILNISIKDIDGETVQLISSAKGLCISTHSACDSYAQEPSHVLQSMGVSKDYIQGSLRISFSDTTSLDLESIKKGVDILVSAITE